MLLMRSARMLWLAVRHRDPAWVTRSDYGWVHRFRGGYVLAEGLRGAPLRVLETNTRDVFFHHYTPQLGDTIVELGAEYGTDTIFLSRAVGPSGRVVAVEAHPRTCAGLSEVVRRNGLENVTVVHAAVGDRVGTTTITDDAALSNVVGQGGVEVLATTLNALFGDQLIDHVDLLKVNIEGAEGPLLAALEMADAERIKHLVVSCHDFRAERGDSELFRTGTEVDRHLRRLGFTWTRRPEHPHEWVRDYRYAVRANA